MKDTYMCHSFPWSNCFVLSLPVVLWISCAKNAILYSHDLNIYIGYCLDVRLHPMLHINKSLSPTLKQIRISGVCWHNRLSMQNLQSWWQSLGVQTNEFLKKNATDWRKLTICNRYIVKQNQYGLFGLYIKYNDICNHLASFQNTIIVSLNEWAGFIPKYCSMNGMLRTWSNLLKDWLSYSIWFQMEWTGQYAKWTKSMVQNGINKWAHG